MAIYTKKGDKGGTKIIGSSKQISKASCNTQAIGAVDELNSYIGVVISFSNDPRLISELKEVQDDLLTIGSILAGSDLRLYKTRTRRLERRIDILEKRLPKLKNFIFPGGPPSASNLHFARTLARRAERAIVAFNEIESAKSRSSSGRKVKPEILVYMNRLSDYLFMLARNQTHQAGVKEVVWRNK